MTTTGPLVTRTLRAAIRLGEDFITVEETITLPLNASDTTVREAVELGQRIYEAQRAAVESQVAAIRGGAPAGPAAGAGATYTPSPRLASGKQIGYIATLLGKASWSPEDAAQQVAEWGGDFENLTVDLASRLIDLLRDNPPPPPSALVNGKPPMLAALDEPPPPADGDIPF